MSRKQLIIAIIVISLTCGLVFDTQREYKKTLTQDIENVYADYAEIKFSGYRFYTLDPIERFVKVSPNRDLKPGTYIVGETKDDNGHTYLNPGTLILKNDDYNDEADIYIDGTLYTLGSESRANVKANYLEVNLKKGQTVVVKRKIGVKATRVMG